MNIEILNYKSFNIISGFSFEVYSPFVRSGFLIIRITSLCSNKGDINGFSSVRFNTNQVRGIDSQYQRNINDILKNENCPIWACEDTLVLRNLATEHFKVHLVSLILLLHCSTA